MTSGDWREEVVNEIMRMYQDDTEYHAGAEFGVTQMAHALQAGHLATQAGGSHHTIIGALLHDIGWKLAERNPAFVLMPSLQEKTFIAVGNNSLASRLGILRLCDAADADAERQQAQHDLIGATFLRMRGFHEDIPHLVEGHVLAKRYLCNQDPAYYATLSDNSKCTLAFQGGPMSDEEARIFERDKSFSLCLEMRAWDDAAKVPDLVVPGLDYYKAMIKECLVGPLKTAEETLPHAYFSRKGNKITGINTISTPASACALASQPPPAACATAVRVGGL